VDIIGPKVNVKRFVRFMCISICSDGAVDEYFCKILSFCPVNRPPARCCRSFFQAPGTVFTIQGFIGARSEQACALGTAMAASVVAGVHSDLAAAQKAMGGGFEREYLPDPERAIIYMKSCLINTSNLGPLLKTVFNRSLSDIM
jgi:hypothetical protein